MFQSTLPARGSDRVVWSGVRARKRFQSTLPARGSDPIRDSVPTGRHIRFNPRSPRGGATLREIEQLLAQMFQSTLPARGSDRRWQSRRSGLPSFNPRSPRGGATQRRRRTGPALDVSIHAPREGERLLIDPPWQFRVWFQSTLPARGSDVTVAFTWAKTTKFQSTLPARGSDEVVDGFHRSRVGVSIHAPREGERHAVAFEGKLRREFQSTLPARGSDPGEPPGVDTGNLFQSTLPARGSDEQTAAVLALLSEFQSTLPARGSDLARDTVAGTQHGVSIHAPREGERRSVGIRFGRFLCRFNPRSPRGGATRGERPRRIARVRLARGFNPRSPRGGATETNILQQDHRDVSIHAPREGERHRPASRPATCKCFNPRSPRGGATR